MTIVVDCKWAWDTVRDDVLLKEAGMDLTVKAKKWSLKRLVKKYLAGTDKPTRKPATKPAHIADLESRLTAHLATKVTVETRKKGRQGRIIIEFYSLDDFDRLTEALGLTVGEEAAEL